MENKELILKDLCGRLPHNTLVYAQNDNDWYESEICTQVISDLINEDYVIKPYLFPLSSMTDEQRKEYEGIIYKNIELHCERYYDVIDIDEFDCLMDFYHKYHFDYRGLIRLDLAIDATNKNVYKDYV
jgi:hypothetical protein